MDTTLITLNVLGMSCQHCERTIKSELEELDGVNLVTADRLDGTVIVSGDNINEVEIIKVIEEIGYEVVK